MPVALLMYLHDGRNEQVAAKLSVYKHRGPPWLQLLTDAQRLSLLLLLLTDAQRRHDYLAT